MYNEKINESGLDTPGAIIKVVGVGGAGGNAVNRMIDSIEGVKFIVANTDAQDLNKVAADIKIQLGEELTGGRGSGAKPDVGKRAAQESKKEIEEALQGANLVFITCGEGGGTGTGAAPIIAEIAQGLGALTIAVVTRPFLFEGPSRKRNSQAGIEELRKHVDSMIIVPNDNLETLIDKNTPVTVAFEEVDNVLRQCVQAISDLVNYTGDINLDFSDVETVMKNSGTAVIGIGLGTGEDRAVKAAQAAVQSPLLEQPITGATRAILNVTGGKNLTLYEIKQAGATIKAYAKGEVDIYLGGVTRESIGDDQIIVTVIATGFDGEKDVTGTDKEVSKREESEIIDNDNQDYSYTRYSESSDGDFVIPAFLKDRNY